MSTSSRHNYKAAAMALVLVAVSGCFTLSLGGLLPNGNFETPPNPSSMTGTEVQGKNAIPNWKTSGFVEFIKSGYKQGDMVLVVPQGRSAVRLGNEASIKQTVSNLVKGGLYALTFSYARTCAQEERLNISAFSATLGGQMGVLPLQTVYSSIGFDSYAWGFHATDNVMEISLHNTGHEEDPACGPIVDTIAINRLRPPLLTHDNLMKNGNLEEGPYLFHKSSWGILIPPNMEDKHSPLPAWMVESLKAVKYIDAAHFTVPSGKRAVELVAGLESAIAQTIRTVPGKTYVMTFKVGDAANDCVGPMQVEAVAGADKLVVPYNSKGKGRSVTGKLVFKAVNRKTRVRFLSMSYTMTMEGSMCGPVVDDVKVVIVGRGGHHLG